MRLVLSGTIEASLLEEVVKHSVPARILSVAANVSVLDEVDASPAVREAVSELCNAEAVDHAYIDADFNAASIRLLVMDMDSTLITIECIDEIADFAGRKKEVAMITDATMRGEIKDFQESLRRRVSLLRGVDAALLDDVFVKRLKLSEGARELLALAKQNGAYTLLLSGGFTYFTDRLCSELGFDAAHANVLAIEDGRLTGRVSGPIVDAEAKAVFVRQEMRRLNCGRDKAMVIGDGANDIPMMREVRHSVAYRAKPAVLESARYAVKFGTLHTLVDFLSTAPTTSDTRGAQI